MSSVHVEPRCEPNVARDKPSVASVLLAISDRNRERAQESAAKKRANIKETEIETMMKMICRNALNWTYANGTGISFIFVACHAKRSPQRRQP